MTILDGLAFLSVIVALSATIALLTTRRSDS